MSYITSMTGTYNPATEKVVPKDAVVLDLKAALKHMSGGVDDLPEVLDHMRKGGGIFAENVADQIEAQTKPPRIPEPKGFAAVVEAASSAGDPQARRHWTTDGDGSWLCSDDTRWSHEWDELIDPVLIRDGIEDGTR